MLRSDSRIVRVFPLLWVAATVFAGSHDGAMAVGQEFVPLENWSYEAVKRFEALGLCVLPSDRPFTRVEFGQIVAHIAAGSVDRPFAPRDRYNLSRLQKEFTGEAARRDPQYRYDPPTLYFTDEPMVFEADVDVAASLERAWFVDKAEVFLGSTPEFKLHWGDHATLYTRYRLLFGPEHGARARNGKPSPRERSFKGLTSLFERAALMTGAEKWHAYYGREYVDWGPSDWNNLIVPGIDYGIDHFGARVKMRGLRLSTVFGTLSPQSRRRFAAHRLELKWRNTVWGLSESAVYAGRDADLVYLFPLSSFYANQFNERGDDNVLWSVDVKGSPVAGLTLYGSLLIDDFQFERNDGTPDKVGYDIGGHYAGTTPIASTLRVRYRAVDIYAYTHRDSVTAYVAGEGDTDAGDPLLGGAPGPDSEQWRFELEVYPRANAVLRGAFIGEGLGEGNDFRRFEDGDDPRPAFPSGTVQLSRVYGLEARWEFDRNMWILGAWAHSRIRNAGHVSGENRNSDAFRVVIHWEFL